MVRVDGGAERADISMTSVPLHAAEDDTRRVVEVGPDVGRRWEAFVAGHPEALVFHHPAYLQALERGYGCESVSLVCEDANGHIRGALPIMKMPGPLRNRHLLSLPHTSIAGPLACDIQSTVALLRAAVARIRAEPGGRLTVRVSSTALDGLVEGLEGIPGHVTFVLRLPERLEDLRFGDSRHHSLIKRTVNKAFRSGVQVRPAESEEQLRAWYRLYLMTMRHHASPPHPYRYFKACWDLLRPRGLMRLLLAEQGEAGHRELLEVSMFLMFGHTVFYVFNGRREKDLGARPNDAIHWQAIHDACRDGFRTFDFGPTRETDKGLVQFKTKWGSETIRLHSYVYPEREVSTPSSPVGRGSQLRRGADALWRRLPLSATAFMGDWFHSYWWE